MVSVSFVEEIRRFTEAGNVFVGDLSNCSAEAKLVWSGKDNHLLIGDRASLSKDTVITFEQGGGSISIGADVALRAALKVANRSSIVIGQRTRFQNRCNMSAFEQTKIEVGADCLFADVTFRTSDMHSIISLQTGERTNRARDIFIGDRVWIAERAAIYKGSHIGSGSVIGGHSVVTSKVPENCLAAGNPATVRKQHITWNKERL